jgi:hypothetical protein
MFSDERQTEPTRNRWQGAGWPFLIWLIVALLACAQASAQIDDEDAVSAGARALDSWWDYPWYDDRADDLRRVNLRSKAPQSTQPQVTPRTAGSGSSDLAWLGWLLIALLAIAVTFILIRLYRQRDSRRSASRAADLVGRAASIDRLEDLPFQFEPQADDLLTAARREHDRGNYDRAIVLLYSHLLLELDRRDAIRLAKGKTNRQYLRELRRRPDMAALLATSLVAFEEVFFGGHALSRQQFERCWHDGNQLLSVFDPREAA